MAAPLQPSSSSFSASTSQPSSTSTSTATPTPPPPPPQSNLFPPTALRPLLYGTLILCPLLALLPPRKLDFYTFALGGAWIASAQEITLGESRRARKAGLGASAPVRASRDGEPENGKEEEEEEEEMMGGVVGIFKRLSRAVGNGRGARGEKGWVERRKEVEREELEERGYGGVILGEVREVLGRDRETGERNVGRGGGGGGGGGGDEERSREGEGR